MFFYPLETDASVNVFEVFIIYCPLTCMIRSSNNFKLIKKTLIIKTIFQVNEVQLKKFKITLRKRFFLNHKQKK